MMRTIKPFALLLFILISSLLHAQTVDHEELLGKTGARLLWDPLMKKGILIKGEKSISFIADEPLFILNGRDTHYDAAVVYDKGILKFSKGTENFISSFFSDNKISENPDSFRVAAIILDPGHGGRDSGANSRFEVDGINVLLMEKNLVLDMALALEEKLVGRFPDKDIILTRRSDVYPSLEERVDLANAYDLEDGEGIVYISIHGNASLNTKAKGYEVWYLPETYRRQIISTDKDDIEPVLNTLLEEEFTLESKKLAGQILENLDVSIGDQTLNRGIKEESWFVVRNAMMASVLVEAGFISNEEETALLRDPLYLKNLNDGIYNGIVDFVNFFENRLD